MEYQAQAVTTILKLLAWFAALFVLLPRLLFPQPEEIGGGERFFANLARMVLVTAVVVQGLVLLHLFDFFSLVASYFAVWLGLTSLRRGHFPLPEFEQAVTFIEAMVIDLLEGNIFPFRTRLIALEKRLRQRVLTWEIERDAWAWGMVLSLVLLISAGLRLAGVPARAAPGDPGTYLHMAWTRLLVSNTIWPNGVYPEGAHSWVQTVAQFARVDEMLLVRTVGGLVGLLLTLAVYLSLRWAGSQRGVAVATTSLYGMFIYAGILPAEAWRQQELHPYEFGLVFLLPALMFGTDFLGAPRRRTLLRTVESLAAAFILHPVAGLMGVIGLSSTLLVRLMRKQRAKGLVRWTISAVGMATLLGNLFLLLGHASGRPRHRGMLDIVVHFFTPKKPDPLWQPLMMGLFLLGLGLLLSPSRSPRTLFRRGLGLCVWFLLALFAGYPTLFSPDKVGIALSLVAVVALGLQLDMVITFVLSALRRLGTRLGSVDLKPSVGLAAGLVALAIAGMTVISPPLRADPGPPQEPESLARVLYRIKNEHLAYTWTVVGYREVLPQVLGRGYFISWEEFLSRYDPVKYRFDPRTPELAIPTRYVFILVEKRVFVGPNDTAADTLKRAQIQLDLMDWVARYQQHHDDMSVYYEDASAAVYQIYRSPEVERRIIEEYEREQFERRKRR